VYPNKNTSSCFNTDLFCRSFLELLDRFSVTIRQVTKSRYVCVCVCVCVSVVLIQARHHVNSLSEDRNLRKTKALNLHIKYLCTPNFEQLPPPLANIQYKATCLGFSSELYKL